MKVARGSSCGDFPQPRVPFVPAPFFGKYATGSAGPPTSTYPGGTYPGATTGPATGGAQSGGTQSGGTQDNGTGGGQKYPPQLYQSPPQPAPTTTTPPGPGGTATGQTGGVVPPGR
jgi:hypothetical protein